jgi:predicted ATPase/class 3 adenylate cyclase
MGEDAWPWDHEVVAPERGLPAGFLTFVLTDIERSTPLLRTLGDDYPVVLARHRALLASAWTAHDGVQVHTVGDDAMAAFSDAAHAVRACVAAQAALRQASWAAAVGLRVRMGVHCGLAAPSKGDYTALAIHQAVRVRATAHGGQVVVSRDVVEAAGHLDDVDFTRLGRFRLRDFDDPVDLFQAQDRTVRERFPALLAVPADGHNLVRRSSSFIGRDPALGALDDAVGAGRATTVVGLGGVGKTRLVSEWGLRAAGRWPDGIWFTDLSQTDEMGVVAAVADAIGAGRTGTEDPWRSVLARLAPMRGVLILDNCEHVQCGAVRLIEAVLDACPELAVLATSRFPLALADEVLVRVAPLDTRGGMTSTAGRLFVDRAVMAGAELAADPETDAVVAAICEYASGVPLAIELAAARANVLHPTEILAGLQRGDDLVRLAPGGSEHHRSLQASLDWTYGLLPTGVKATYRRLAVFAGSFDLEGAGVALDGGDGGATRSDPLHIVSDLVDAGLLTADLAAGGTRYRYLPPIRQDALRRLMQTGDGVAVQRKLAAWYAESFGPPTAMSQSHVSRFRAEFDNVRGLVSDLAGVDVEQAQALAVCVVRFHKAVGDTAASIADATTFLTELPTPTPERVGLLCRLSSAQVDAADVAGARATAGEAAVMAKAVGAPAWSSVCVDFALGSAACAAGEERSAARIARRALARDLRSQERAEMLYLLALATSDHDMPAALVALEEAVGLEQQHGDDWSVAMTTLFLATLAYRAGQVTPAVHHLRTVLGLGLRLGNRALLAAALQNVAYVIADDQPETAVRLFECGAREFATGGSRWLTDEATIYDALPEVVAGLGVTAAEDARSAGAALQLQAAIEQAEAALDARVR